MDEANGIGEPEELTDLDKALDMMELLQLEGLSEDDAVAKVAEQYPDLMEILRTLVVVEGSEVEVTVEGTSNPQDGIS